MVHIFKIWHPHWPDADIFWQWPNVTVYEPLRETSSLGDQVWTSILGLRVRVTDMLFHKGMIRIKCVSNILSQSWQIQQNITHQNKNFYQPSTYSNPRGQHSSGKSTYESRFR